MSAWGQTRTRRARSPRVRLPPMSGHPPNGTSALGDACHLPYGRFRCDTFEYVLLRGECWIPVPLPPASCAPKRRVLRKCVVVCLHEVVGGADQLVRKCAFCHQLPMHWVKIDKKRTSGAPCSGLTFALPFRCSNPATPASQLSLCGVISTGV